MKTPRQIVLALCVSGLMTSAAVAATADKNDPLASLPPQGSVQLSQLIAKTEQRPGFYAIKSITYADGQYNVVYYMSDGAEVRLGYDAKTGDTRPPKSGGGLFGN